MSTNTRTMLACVRADRRNLSTMIGHRGDKTLVLDSAKKRLSFARTVIEFYADLISSAYRIDNAELITREINQMATIAKKQFRKYASQYPAEFAGFTYAFPTLDRLNASRAVKTEKPAKAQESDGQTALPFDNSNTLEKRLDRLESILARLDRHLQPTEEKYHENV